MTSDGNYQAAASPSCPGGVPHTYLVASDAATILEVIAPGGLEQAFREAGWDLRNPPPDDWACTPDAVAAAMAKVGCTILGTPPGSPGDNPIASAEAAHLAGLVALLDGTGEEEEHAGDETVRDHPEDRGVDTEGGEGRDAEHHEAHVRDRRERDEALHISLRETTQRSVDDADHR